MRSVCVRGATDPISPPVEVSLAVLIEQLAWDDRRIRGESLSLFGDRLGISRSWSFRLGRARRIGTGCEGEFAGSDLRLYTC